VVGPNFLRYGIGAGIEIHADRLRVAILRIRPSEVLTIAEHQIERYRERPASEWGAEYAALLKQHDASHAAAVAVLPRHELIVRTLDLPGVTAKDLDAAVRYQIDGLHPYGDDTEISYSHARLNSRAVLVAIARRETVDYWLTLFAEAGIALASLAPSAAVIWSAFQTLDSPAPEARLHWNFGEDGAEIYGQSPARPLYSTYVPHAGLDDAVRLKTAALAELRIDDREAQPLPDLARSAAVSSALPRRALAVNLIPLGQRQAHSRLWLLPTAALAVILAALGAALWLQQDWQNRELAKKLEAEIARLEPRSREAASLDQQTKQMRERLALLAEWRTYTRADLDTLLELTRTLPPPAWVNGLDITREQVSISGEGQSSESLIALLDQSPRFKDTQFTMPPTRTMSGEMFRLRAARETPGPSTPKSDTPKPDTSKPEAPQNAAPPNAAFPAPPKPVAPAPEPFVGVRIQ
jgi:Tfp pilus assembly protein PilN